jgi:hypothetical protein
LKKLNEKVVSVQIATEKKKPSSQSTLNDEYTGKVIKTFKIIVKFKGNKIVTQYSNN